jgi:hypothetical protein
MSVVTASTIARALMPGAKRYFGDMLQKHDSVHTKMYDAETSTKRYEEYVQLVGLGLLNKKTEGHGMSFDTIRQGFITRLVTETWALGFAITAEAFADNQHPEILKNQTARLARAVQATYDVLAAQPYNRAFNSSYKGGDSKELCATDHPHPAAGGTWSNELSTSADFSEAAVEQAAIDIGDWLDPRGITMKAKITKLIHPNEIRFDVARFMSTEKTVGTANNDMNVARGLISEAVLCHDLTEADAWFLRTDIPGMRFIDREKPRFGTDNDFQTENAYFKVVMRCVFGWDDPHNVFGSPGA